MDLGLNFPKDLFQQRRLHDVLGLRETAQADGSGTDLLLHPRQLRGGAEPAHRAHDRIEQPERASAKYWLWLKSRCGSCQDGGNPPFGTARCRRS